MARKDIIAISNALTDIIFPATDEEISRLIKKEIGSDDLEKIIRSRNIEIIPGGSPANVVADASYLGAKCGLIGSIGGDRIGELYKEDLKKNSIEDLLNVVPSEKSGICYVLISPSKDRMFESCLNATSRLFFQDAEKAAMKDYEIFHTSLYELATDRAPVLNAMKFAKETGRIVSFDFASERVIKKEIGKNWAFDDLISYADIKFANESEAAELRKNGLFGQAQGKGILVEKLGEKGSRIYFKGSAAEIPEYPCELVNTNGAGDAYAAGFLVSYLEISREKGRDRVDLNDLRQCGKKGSRFASLICSTVGARLK
ncbi:MAG: adenosine kinase [archaeon]